MIFPEAITFIAEDPRPKILKIDIFTPIKTLYYSLGPIPYNKNTNVGNIIVLENIFRQ